MKAKSSSWQSYACTPPGRTTEAFFSQNAISNAVHRSASFIPVSSQLIVNAHSPAIYLKLYSIVGEYMVFSVE